MAKNKNQDPTASPRRHQMIEFIKKLFGFNKKQKTVKVELRKNNYEQDDIDYDGMGNYGRFPMTKNGRYK